MKTTTKLFLINKLVIGGLLSFMLFFVTTLNAQNVITSVFVDDFERTDFDKGGMPETNYGITKQVIAGASPADPELRNEAAYGTRLRIANKKPDVGRVWVSGELSAYLPLFNTKLKNTEAESVIWTYNVRNNSTATYLGFDDNQRGFATVLLADGSDFSVASGYAIAYWGAKSDDTENASVIRSFRLIKFSGGLNANSKITTLIEESDNMTTTASGYYSIKLTYAPGSDTWELFKRLDASSSSGTHLDPLDEETKAYSLVGSVVDNTYTSTEMNHFGFLNNYEGTGDYIQNYDNYRVRVVNTETSTSVNNKYNKQFYTLNQSHAGVSITGENLTITLFDMSGSVIKQKEISGTHRINNIRKGLYILKLKSAFGQQETVKLQIQ